MFYIWLFWSLFYFKDVIRPKTNGTQQTLTAYIIFSGMFTAYILFFPLRYLNIGLNHFFSNLWHNNFYRTYIFCGKGILIFSDICNPNLIFFFWSRICCIILTFKTYIFSNICGIFKYFRHLWNRFTLYAQTFMA